MTKKIVKPLITQLFIDFRKDVDGVCSQLRVNYAAADNEALSHEIVNDLLEALTQISIKHYKGKL